MTAESFDLRRVDLNLLVAFDALMAERSVTGAAIRMSVTQSAMSASLARLRALLDDPVLERSGRRMLVTPLAEAMTARVREILDEVRSVLAARSGFDPARDRRSYTVTASDYEATAILHPLLALLATEAPGIQLRIQPPDHDVGGGLERDQVDLLLAPKEVLPGVGGFHHEILYTDHHVVAADADNARFGEPLSLEEFCAMPHVVAHLDLHPSLVDAHLERLGVARDVQVTAGFLLAPFLLKGTSLITVTSRLLAHRLSHSVGLKLAEAPVELPPLSTVMAWTGRTHDDPGHQWLRARLRQVAQDAVRLGQALPEHMNEIDADA